MPESTQHTDDSNYGHLSEEALEEKLDEAVDEIKQLKTKLNTMWSAQLTLHQTDCFINDSVEALENLSEYWQGEARGDHVYTGDQLNWITAAIATMEDELPLNSATGAAGDGASNNQELKALIVKAAEVKDMSDQQKVVFYLRMVLTRAFYGTGSVLALSTVKAIKRVKESITLLSDRTILALQSQGLVSGDRVPAVKIALQVIFIGIFTTYIFPYLMEQGLATAIWGVKACSAKAAATCAKVCVMQGGGKRKSRKHRGHKKRKSRKGYKSHKRKGRKGKTHKRKGRKGNKSRRRKH